jgi:hypothetical protein
MLVTSTPIDTTQFVPPKVVGPAVQMTISFAGTSGRFSVAMHASRLFPKRLAAFIERVSSEYVTPDSEFAPRRYARDSVTSLDSLVTAFVTPAASAGSERQGSLVPRGIPYAALQSSQRTSPSRT